MSNYVKLQMKDARTKIQNQCKLFQNNYQEFLTLSLDVKCSKDIDANIIDNFQNLLKDLNEGNVRLIFCGQVKSGKSRCIIEFLSGKLNLPSRETPTTTFFTVIQYSENPVLYSANSNNEIINYKFDGKTVDNNLVGRINNLEINNGDLEVIYYVGIPYTFLENNFIIIDTPGLNETSNISDAFFVNLKKLNPQLIVFIYDAGPGFTSSDDFFCTKIIANSRMGLKKIFLFNKYDIAFQTEKIFNESDNEVAEIDSQYESESEDDQDENDLREKASKLEKYQIKYDQHLTKLTSFSSEENKVALIGYSGRLVKRFREHKENEIPFLLNKHIDFLLEIHNQINTINNEVIQKMINLSECYLLTKFKTVYNQILGAKDKDFRRYKLSGDSKEKLLQRFDQCHSEIIIQPLKMNQMELDGMINEIIKDHLKHASNEKISSKLSRVTDTLIQFIGNRYINLFSNVIQSSLDGVSFASFHDEIIRNDLQNFFSHAICTLRNEDECYNLNSVIEKHFKKELLNANKKSIDIRPDNPGIYDSYKEYFRNNITYDIESILPTIDDYKKIKLHNEKKLLENAIDKKLHEIDNDYQLTEQETELKIKETIKYFKTWVNFNNNYILTLKDSTKICPEKKKLLEEIVGGTLSSNVTCSPNDSNVYYICKQESIIYDEISCKNCTIIQYFLRTQNISQYLFSSSLYFHEESQKLYFLTEISDFQPLRNVLPQLKNSQKFSLTRKLVEIIDILYSSRLPIPNLGPDMIFCKVCSQYDEVQIKLTENVQQFHQWNFNGKQGDSYKEIFFKYPFYKPSCSIGESILSMFYSLAWIILIILHGKCVNFVNADVRNKQFKKILTTVFKDYLGSNIFINAQLIIARSLKQPFEQEILADIHLLFEHFKEFNNYLLPENSN